jgi:two-component system CheB/CheR fusion protein
VRAREALHQANEVLRLAVVVRDAHDALTVQDGQGRILAWNPAAERLYGWTEAEALLMKASDRIPVEEQAAESDRTSRLRRGETIPPYQGGRLTKSGGLVRVTITATALFDEPGAAYAIATTERALE